MTGKDKLTMHSGAGFSRIRLRAIIIGLLIIPADNYWVILMEKVRRGPYPTVISLFINTIFILTIIVALNRLVRRVRPKWGLSTAEILLIYTMTTVAAALAGHDMLPTLIAVMSYPWMMASESNGWAETFLPALPKWLSVTDKAILTPLYQGDSSLYVHGYWRPWVLPSLWWICFASAVVFVMICLNSLVRKQWIEYERLTFPIVQLPLAMAEPGGTIWRSKLFWIGFAGSFGVELLNGLSFYWPAIPHVELGVENNNLAQGLATKPWSAIGWMPASFYPFMIGMGYMLPADLCFSTWFFFLFWKFQKILACAIGMDVGWDDPFIRHQEFGGAMAIVLLLALSSRGYLRRVWQCILGRSSDLDDREEAMPYRWAAIGAGIGFVLVAGFMTGIGMNPLTAAAAFLIYFAIAILIARIRAELGPPIHDMPFGADFAITSLIGVGRLGNGDLVGLSYMSAFHGAYRSHPMPIVLEGMKMAQATRSSLKKLLAAVILAVVVGASATFWAYLHLGYKYGLDAKWNYGAAWAWSFTKTLDNWWRCPPDMARPDWSGNTAMLGGFLFSLLLGYVRLRVANWPFHPIGYVVSGTYQVHLVWLPLLIAWLAKVSILRYGGLKTYKQAMPLFLGMIIGELMMGCLWGIIGMIFDVPYYNFFGA